MAPKPDGTLASSSTGLILRPEGERLRLVDPVSGPILWEEELEAARQAAEERAQQEAAARQAAEERSKTLADELSRLRAELERARRGL